MKIEFDFADLSSEDREEIVKSTLQKIRYITSGRKLRDAKSIDAKNILKIQLYDWSMNFLTGLRTLCGDYKFGKHHEEYEVIFKKVNIMILVSCELNKTTFKDKNEFCVNVFELPNKLLCKAKSLDEIIELIDKRTNANKTINVIDTIDAEFE